MAHFKPLTSTQSGIGIRRPGINCLLVSANEVVTPYPVYPLGAACLVRALEEAGHRVVHFDLLADGGKVGLAHCLKRTAFDLIGVSIRNLDTVDSTDPHDFMADLLEVVHLLRSLSSAPLVLGGPAFSIVPEELMALLEADYGIAGEGETLLCGLGDDLANGRPPPVGLLHGQGSETHWGKSTLSSSTVDYYLARGGMLNVQTKRGCPYQCGYCSYPGIEGRTIRYREPDEVADQVERLSREHGARFLFFTDAVFNDSAGHYLQVAEALVRHGNTTPWCAFFRPKNIKKADLVLLKRAGLAAMELGTDGACDQTLAGFHKGFCFAHVMEINRLAVEQAIACAHFIMFGGPGEDEKTLEEGLANIENLPVSVVFAYTGIRIFPQTKIHDRALAEGLLPKDQSLLHPVFYFSPKVSRARLEDEISLSFAGRLDRMYPCANLAGRIGQLHAMGHVGPMWDALIRHELKK